MKLPSIIVIVVVALWAAGCGTSEEAATSSSTNATETSATSSEPDASEESVSGDTPTPTTIPDGTWKEGEYQPGTYRAPGGGSCKWEQRQKPGGEASGEGFNENYGYGETNILIEINSPYFFTEECGTWKKVGA